MGTDPFADCPHLPLSVAGCVVRSHLRSERVGTNPAAACLDQLHQLVHESCAFRITDAVLVRLHHLLGGDICDFARRPTENPCVRTICDSAVRAPLVAVEDRVTGAEIRVPLERLFGEMFVGPCPAGTRFPHSLACAPRCVNARHAIRVPVGPGKRARVPTHRHRWGRDAKRARSGHTDDDDDTASVCSEATAAEMLALGELGGGGDSMASFPGSPCAEEPESECHAPVSCMHTFHGACGASEMSEPPDWDALADEFAAVG